MSEALKPCPWPNCEGTGSLRYEGFFGYRPYIECAKCYCRGPRFYFGRTTADIEKAEQAAVSAWNTRAEVKGDE